MRHETASESWYAVLVSQENARTEGGLHSGGPAAQELPLEEGRVRGVGLIAHEAHVQTDWESAFRVAFVLLQMQIAGLKNLRVGGLFDILFKWLHNWRCKQANAPPKQHTP